MVNKEVLNIYVNCKVNNTHVVVFNPKDKKTLIKLSCGIFVKGAFRSSSTVVEQIIDELGGKLVNFTGSQFNLFFKGFSVNRNFVYRCLIRQKLEINSIFFVNSRVFNGCRKKKQRRL